MTALQELGQAFALLTRLPEGWFVRPATPPVGGGGRGDGSACIWAFPIVGAVIGAIGAAVYWLGRGVGVPPALATALALAAQIVATGGFHEDGLADTADGFGGGTTREKKLTIMRDSRIGTFGVLAVVFSLAIRGGAIFAIHDRARVAAALVVAGALGRGAIVGVLALLQPARADGLGASVNRPAGERVSSALGLALLAAVILLPAPLAVGALLVAASACAATTSLAQAQIGGYTGDVLGAAEQVTECVTLTLLATAMRM